MAKAPPMKLGWEEFAADCGRLAGRVAAGGRRYDRMLCVSRGGVFVGGMLAHLLDYRFVTTIALKLYDGRRPGAAVEMLARPDMPPPGGRVLVVDDLLDSGRTFAWIREQYGQTHRLEFAALYDKGGGAFRPLYIVRALDPARWLVFPWEAAALAPAPSV